MTRRLRYASAALDATQVSLDQVGRYLEALMLRNFATAGWVFHADGVDSVPGCIIASPSRPDASDVTDQDYVYCWVRDAAICALAAARTSFPADGLLDEYVRFSALAADRAAADGTSPGHACFRIDGSVRPWSEQSDGPAMQIVTLLELLPRLSAGPRDLARRLLRIDLEYLLDVLDQPTMNLWEETIGRSFFARAVQLRALRRIAPRLGELGLDGFEAQVHAGAEGLMAALREHWDGTRGRYRSILDPTNGARGADLDVDVVMAAISGEVPCTDPKLLATAAQVRAGFAAAYPINAADAQRGIGPLVGRYPEDQYDGDLSDPGPDSGQPWALCTCNFAELYYRVAAQARRAGKLVVEAEGGEFFRQIGVADTGTVSGAAAIGRVVDALTAAGDRMLRAVLFHSDHLELSEQFDRDTGYEKSVRNLTWSYASFLDALRARGSLGR